MTGLVGVCNVAIDIGVLAVLLILIRRPSTNWRTGRWGKAVSITMALLASFHLAAVTVPIGAVVAVVRHRNERQRGPGVPLADAWPGR